MRGKTRFSVLVAIFVLALCVWLQLTPPEFIYERFVKPRAAGAASISDLTGTTGLIGKEDISWGTGLTTDTFTVTAYDASTVTLTKLPNFLANAYSIIKGQWYVTSSTSIADHGAASGADYVAGNLKKIVDTIGGTDVRAIRMPPGVYVIGTSLACASNIYLDPDPGALVKPSAGRSLTLYSPGHLVTPPSQRFVDITNNSVNPLLFTTPGHVGWAWWGATGNGTTDDTITLQLAFTAAANGSIELGPNTYLCNLTITNPMTIYASYSSVLKATALAPVVTCMADEVNLVGGLRINGNSVGTNGWYHTDASNGSIDGLYITNCTSNGIYVFGGVGTGCYYNQFRNPVVKSNAGSGIKVYGSDSTESRTNANIFIGGTIESNTLHGFELQYAKGTSVQGTAVEKNGGYAYNLSGCTAQSLTVLGGWVESNTTGGVTVSADTKGVQFYGTRFNQVNPFAGSGISNTGNVFMVDDSDGVLTHWMETIGQAIKNAYIYTPAHHTLRVVNNSVTYTLSNELQSDQTHTNSGATVVITGNLPVTGTTSIGTTYRFSRNNTSLAHLVDPGNSTDIIRNAGTVGGAGKYLSLDTNGVVVDLQCIVSGVWEIVNHNGVTTDFSFEP